MQRRIHIICGKPEIGILIKKALAATDFIISCDSGESLNEGSITGFQENVDCLIIDKIVNPGIVKKAKEIFNKSYVIYLPSLEPSGDSFDDFKNISAPLRLSELSEKLEDLFKVNKS